MTESEERILKYSKFVSDTAQEAWDLIHERVLTLEGPKVRVLLSSRIIMLLFNSQFRLGLQSAAEQAMKAAEAESKDEHQS